MKSDLNNSQKDQLQVEISKNKQRVMNGYINNSVVPKMNRFANQRHLVAIRNAVVANIPLIIIGALFLILLNFPIGLKDGDTLGSIMPAKLNTAFLQVYRMTMGLLAVVTSFCIGSELAKSYKMDPTTSGVLSLIGFMMWVGVDVATNTIKIGALGSNGLFVAIISGILIFEFYRLCKKYNITLRMPRQVPAAVANSFIILIPLAIYALIVMTLRFIVGFDFINDMGKILSPLQSVLNDTLGGTMVIALLITFFWIFGLSGASLVGSIMRPFWTQAIEANADAFLNGSEIPYRYPEQFMQWGVWVGGSGATLGLIIAALLLAKSKQVKSIAKTSAIPGIFNINEPVIFGMPIMLNLYLILPFIFVPQIAILVNALWVKIFAIQWVALAPWTLPGPIGAVLSSGVNPFGWVPAVSTIIVSTVVYAPFLIAYDKQILKEEKLLANDQSAFEPYNFVQSVWYTVFSKKSLNHELIKQAKEEKIQAKLQYKENQNILKQSNFEAEKIKLKLKKLNSNLLLHN
ncbi:PTS system cellobiose-specific component IIC [Spiroplasma clarkii]|uniref:PTS sugar transporter subunit IIC n=1 Tax=Spiroplasma clarkii TaxID=2139 RepID=UPI000B57BF9F|nr:PTS transporter subunit EIIC [Spiroplasma clarkii]ARU91889.1 PTS system cellobiose-specific component IIC [Spiroplasma clarkii]